MNENEPTEPTDVIEVSVEKRKLNWKKIADRTATAVLASGVVLLIASRFKSDSTDSETTVVLDSDSDVTTVTEV